MLNVCKSLIINILLGGVNLNSMLFHTLNPRQAEMACLGFFFAYLCLSGSSESPLPLLHPLPPQEGDAYWGLACQTQVLRRFALPPFPLLRGQGESKKHPGRQILKS